MKNNRLELIKQAVNNIQGSKAERLANYKNWLAQVFSDLDFNS